MEKTFGFFSVTIWLTSLFVEETPYRQPLWEKKLVSSVTIETHMYLSIDTTVSLPSISKLFIYLFIWGFTSLSTLYRSYHDG